MPTFSAQLALLATVTLGTISAVAAPASAEEVTFATFSPATSNRNFRFINLGNAGARSADALIYTTSTATATSPGAAAVKFSFLIAALTPFLTNVDALYTLNGTVAKNSSVTSLGAFSQAGFSGSFSFVSISAITVEGPGLITQSYAAGANLLSGKFSNGSIAGNIGGTSGSSFASGTTGPNMSFSSDFLNFSNVASLGRASSLTAVSPRFGKHAGPNGALSSFRALTGGQFSSDPAPVANALAAVPEPTTWAMMVIGFGIVGLSSRRRQRCMAA